jgi:hypothetical protein
MKTYTFDHCFNTEDEAIAFCKTIYWMYFKQNIERKFITVLIQQLDENENCQDIIIHVFDNFPDASNLIKSLWYTVGSYVDVFIGNNETYMHILSKNENEKEFNFSSIGLDPIAYIEDTKLQLYGFTDSILIDCTGKIQFIIY